MSSESALRDGDQAGFDLIVPRDAVGGTPAEYSEQVLNNTIAVLGRLTTVDELISEWALPAA